MPKFLLMNIGCIECGVSSKIVGVFDDEPTAEQIAQELKRSHGWRGGGQNDFEVFQMPTIENVVDSEYLASVQE